MFHLNFLTKDTHPNLQDITKAATQHPKRPFIIERSNYNLPHEQVKHLLHQKCKVCIQKSDNFSIKKIEELINIGKDAVALRAAEFKEDHLVKYLEKGASVLITKNDGLNAFQVRNLVQKGKEKTYIIGSDFTVRQLTDYIKQGGSVLLKKNDLSPFAITRLLPFGKDRLNIHGGGFSEFRIDKFLVGKAIVTIGEGNLLARSIIEKKAKNFKHQIQIESAHFNDDAWVNKLERLGAVIV